MRNLLCLVALLPAPLAAQAGPVLSPPATPRSVTGASAPEAPVNGVVILYGNQQCPTNAAGEEVVVCARRSASEQFRIPRELRDGTLKPEYESFALKGQAILDAGRTGVGACEPTGAGGGATCRLQEIQNWGREKKAARAANKNVPLDD